MAKHSVKAKCDDENLRVDGFVGVPNHDFRVFYGNTNIGFTKGVSFTADEALKSFLASCDHLIEWA